MAQENIGKTGFARGSLLRDSPISGSFVNLCPSFTRINCGKPEKIQIFYSFFYNFKTENARKLGSLIWLHVSSTYLGRNRSNWSSLQVVSLCFFFCRKCVSAPLQWQICPILILENSDHLRSPDGLIWYESGVELRERDPPGSHKAKGRAKICNNSIERWPYMW